MIKRETEIDEAAGATAQMSGFDSRLGHASNPRERETAMTTAITPTIGSVARGYTTTATAQAVIIAEVTAIESETEAGWMVWGYRPCPRRNGRRQTMNPRLYWIPRESE